MKFILELFKCGGSCASTSSESRVQKQPPEEIGLLAAAPRPRVCRRSRCRGGVRRWKPTLTSISEDVLTAEKRDRAAAAEPDKPIVRWRRCIGRKILSVSKKDRSRSFDHDEYCRKSVSLSAIMPAFSGPFMF